MQRKEYVAGMNSASVATRNARVEREQNCRWWVAGYFENRRWTRLANQFDNKPYATALLIINAIHIVLSSDSSQLLNIGQTIIGWQCIFA